MWAFVGRTKSATQQTFHTYPIQIFRSTGFLEENSVLIQDPDQTLFCCCYLYNLLRDTTTKFIRIHTPYISEDFPILVRSRKLCIKKKGGKAFPYISHAFSKKKTRTSSPVVRALERAVAVAVFVHELQEQHGAPVCKKIHGEFNVWPPRMDIILAIVFHSKRVLVCCQECFA